MPTETITTFSATPTDSGANPALPHREANTPFMLGFSERSYVYCEDGKIRPMLRQHPLQPGINNVGNLIAKDTGAMAAAVQQTIRARKQIAIPFDSAPKGFSGYCRSIKAHDPRRRRDGLYWCAAWAEGTIRSEREHTNWKVFDLFLAHWRKLGLIPAAPPRDLVEVKVRELDVKLSNASARDISGKSHRVRELGLELDAWRALLERAVAADNEAAEADAAAAEPTADPEPEAEQAPSTFAPPKPKRKTAAAAKAEAEVQPTLPTETGGDDADLSSKVD